MQSAVFSVVLSDYADDLDFYSTQSVARVRVLCLFYYSF